MTAEENRSSRNLLLLCHKHHTEVDSPDAVSQFPEELLHDWKDAQVEAAAGQGVELSDEEAAELVRSFTDASTSINANHLMVGGTGGTAPGAAGGGGGAIGPGALGGPGGSATSVDLDGTPGAWPGAGGGGGGVLDIGVGTPVKVQPGSEGSGGVYGMDGQHGGTSAFGEFLLAPGGAGGRSGRGVRLTSEKLRISTLLVGEYFSVRNSLLSVVSAGWTWVVAASLPLKQSLAVFLMCEAGELPRGDYTLKVEVRGPAGEVGGALAFPVTVDEQGDVLRIPVPVGMLVEWTSYGKWTVVASSEVAQLAQYDLLVKPASA